MAWTGAEAAKGSSGATLATIEKAFGMHNCGVSRVVSRMKNEIREDASLRRRVERIERELQMSQEQI